MSEAVPTDEDDAAHGRYLSTFVVGSQAEGLQVPPSKGSQLGKTLGSSYEIQSFGVQLRDRLVVVTPRRHAAFQFGDQRRVGCTIGRTEAHIGSPLRAVGLQLMRPERTRVDFDHQEMRVTPGHDLDLGKQAGLDGIGHKVGHAFLQIEWVFDAHHVASPILDLHDESPTGRVREGDQRPQGGFPRREVALEFEGIALGSTDEVLGRHTTTCTTKARPPRGFGAVKPEALDQSPKIGGLSRIA